MFNANLWAAIKMCERVWILERDGTEEVFKSQETGGDVVFTTEAEARDFAEKLNAQIRNRDRRLDRWNIVQYSKTIFCIRRRVDMHLFEYLLDPSTGEPVAIPNLEDAYEQLKRMHHA